MSARIRTTLLPEIGAVQGIGDRAGLQGPWPTNDPIPENDPIRAFIDTIDGIFAGWKEVTSLVPTRDPSLFADPAAGIGLIQDDLAQACGALAWITSTTVCSRLSSSLAEALAAPDVARRRGALTDFLVELDAQHDPALGLPVTDNAFYLLSVNAHHVRDNVLPPPLCGEVRTVPLLAAQTLDAGAVNVWNDAQTLFVRYDAAIGWLLAETHLSVGLSLSGIPSNKAGNPVIGKFPYARAESPPVASVTHMVPLLDIGAGAGSALLLAAHGSVSGTAGTETAWARGTRFEEQGSWGMYFGTTVAACP